jgi:hypothetical protein
VIVVRFLLLCLVLAVAAGCGADEDEPAAPREPEPATTLVVRVDSDGPRGSARPKQATVRCRRGDSSRACRTVARLRPADFGPMPDNVACTEIFGGPETARISGRLRGEAVSATFSRANGCQIHRWETFAGLLEQVG